MLKEYVFWLKMITKNAFFSNWLWDIPKKLIKVVVTDSQIRFDSPIGIDSQDILAIDFPNIAQITWSASSPGSIGYVEISTQESKHYYLIPVNPLDPTLVLLQDNTDELIAFCNIVEALKNNQPPDFDKNPYIRQFQKKAKPAYLKDKEDIILWDKNTSPLEYYYALVPESEEKKRLLVIKIYKIIVFCGLGILAWGFLHGLHSIFK